MGRYERYKKQKLKPIPKQKKVILTIRNVALALVLLTGIAGFILQFVMNLKK